MSLQGDAYASLGQWHTTRDFWEPTGHINAGGGGSMADGTHLGGTGYEEWKWEQGQVTPHSTVIGYGWGGYGGWGGSRASTPSTGYRGGKWGDGTVLVRYWQ